MPHKFLLHTVTAGIIHAIDKLRGCHTATAGKLKFTHPQEAISGTYIHLPVFHYY